MNGAEGGSKLGCGKGGPRDSGCACYLADRTTLSREGNCLRYPPQITLSPVQTDKGVQVLPTAQFPRVARDWFCYEWRAAPEEPKGEIKPN